VQRRRAGIETSACSPSPAAFRPTLSSVSPKFPVKLKLFCQAYLFATWFVCHCPDFARTFFGLCWSLAGPCRADRIRCPDLACILPALCPDLAFVMLGLTRALQYPS
jgi:hypothetical protein